MYSPAHVRRRRATGSVLVGGSVAALLLSGCTLSSSDTADGGRQSSKMSSGAEQITAVIESHLEKTCETPVSFGCLVSARASEAAPVVGVFAATTGTESGEN